MQARAHTHTHTLKCRHAYTSKLAREIHKPCTHRHARSERGSASVTQHGEIRLLCNSEICNLHVNNPWSAASPGCSASSLSLPTSPALRVPILSPPVPPSRTSTSLHLTANVWRGQRGEENGGWMREGKEKWKETARGVCDCKEEPSGFLLCFSVGLQACAESQ